MNDPKLLACLEDEFSFMTFSHELFSQIEISQLHKSNPFLFTFKINDMVCIGGANPDHVKVLGLPLIHTPQTSKPFIPEIYQDSSISLSFGPADACSQYNCVNCGSSIFQASQDLIIVQLQTKSLLIRGDS